MNHKYYQVPKYVEVTKKNKANDIARSDIRATFNQLTQAVEGTITVRSFALNANPLEEEGSVVGTFPFTAQRVKAN